MSQLSGPLEEAQILQTLLELICYKSFNMNLSIYLINKLVLGKKIMVYWQKVTNIQYNGNYKSMLKIKFLLVVKVDFQLILLA